ncbi:tetratricopeptide repeat protein [Amycolatopsis sp. NPDC059027]|uniref:tetratricopeptide repeat protein n=1 Tax=unclassified Amycolatopsis TaxID=2618356 RepID=UPI00366F688C
MAEGFGVLLRQLRQLAQQTQQQLAERSGVSVRAISGFESGRRTNPRTHTVRQLAQALCLEPDLYEELLAAAAGSVFSDSPHGPPRLAASMPRHLPAQPGVFVGRHDELAVLDKAFDAAGQGGMVVVSAVGGGGIGKSWLALRWAHTNSDRFPDGQLFVDLRGFTPHRTPMTAAEATRVLVGALGVAPAAIPADLDSQTALYRGLTAGKRMLILLDNARDAEQVAPLLPGGESCAVIVTSRDRLAGLVAAHGATPLPLDVLDDTDARHLLTCRVGSERLATEPRAVTELLARCAGLPLALAVVAARAAIHPDLPLTEIAAELGDTESRLDALDAGDPTASVRAALSCTDRALRADHARVFALLGAAPGPDISLPAAASLTALPDHDAVQALRALERLSLLHQPAPGRYRMHDLVKLFAADHTRHPPHEHDRHTALRRLVDFYLHTAADVDRLLYPYLTAVPLDPAEPGCRPRRPADLTAAIAWLDTERPNLLAAQQLAVSLDWPRRVWQLAWALRSVGWQSGPDESHLAVWQAGLAAADRLCDTAAQILIRRYLGRAHVLLGHHEQAMEILQQALALAERAEDPDSRGHVHRYMAWAWEQRGDDRAALIHAEHALRLFHAHGSLAGETDALNMVGWSQARLGDHEHARDHCQAALALCRHHGFRETEAYTLGSLGYIAHHTGQHAQALDYYQQALALFHARGDTCKQADTLEEIGQTHHALGHHEQARDHWQQALGLYRAQHRDDDAERAQQHLDALDTSAGTAAIHHNERDDPAPHAVPQNL